MTPAADVSSSTIEQRDVVISIEGASKAFSDGEVVAFENFNLDVLRARGSVHRGAFGMWQDHLAEMY